MLDWASVVSMSVTTRDQANATLKQVALLQAALAVATGRFDRLLARLKEKFFPRISKLKEEITHACGELESWAKESRAAEFGQSKTLALPFGALKFHQCPPAVDFLSGWNQDKSLQAMQERAAEQKKKKNLYTGEIDWAKYIRWTPTIDKALILRDISERAGPGTAALPRAHLRQVGLKIVENESFLIYPDPQPATAAVA